MRWPSRSVEASPPHGLSLLRSRSTARIRTGAPAPRGDPTTKRVLLWFAIIGGLMVGFWLQTIVVALAQGT